MNIFEGKCYLYSSLGKIDSKRGRFERRDNCWWVYEGVRYSSIYYDELCTIKIPYDKRTYNESEDLIKRIEEYSRIKWGFVYKELKKIRLEYFTENSIDFIMRV